MKFNNPFAKSPSPKEVKESAVAASMVMSPGQPAWSDSQNPKFARESYAMNVVANAAISRVAEAVASVKWTAWSGETEVTTSPLLDLINKPSPTVSGSAYMQSKVSFMLIYGNAYEERLTDTKGLPVELYVHMPDRMQVIPGTAGIPEAFQYNVNGRKTTWPVDRATGESDILHTKLFNPLDDWYGMSPVTAGAYAIDQHNEAMSWMQSLLQNAATPSGALVTANETSMTDEQFARLKAELETSHQGSKNAGRPMLLEGGLDWKPMGLSPTDMGIIETKYSSARDVALAFGVPPQLLGIPGDNTYANYAEARLAFWEDTVLPLLARIGDDWTNWIGKPYGLELKPDLDQIPAIVDKRQTLWAMLDQSRSLTINEKREAMGFQPIAGGDALDTQAAPVADPIDQKAMSLIAGYEVKAPRLVAK